MRRLFEFKRKEDEMLKGCCMRTARAARIIWKKMKLSFHGLDMGHKAKCGHTVVEVRLRMEKHGTAEECESPEHCG